MFSNLQAVLFDLDGTLIDSAPDLGAAVDKMRTDRGLPSYPLGLYRPMAGAGARGMLELAFNIAPGHHDFESLREEFFRNYENCLTERTFAFDGIPEVIAHILRRGLKWGVVTNKAERFAIPITQGMPLFATSCVVVGGDTTPHAKPHPAPMLEAAKRAGVEPARCLYVGDDLRDILAGKAAGMLTVAASYGYLGKATEVNEWGAQAMIAQPVDLIALLR